MTSEIKSSIAFILGGAMGFGIGYAILKPKYEKFAQEEINKMYGYLGAEEHKEPVEKAVYEENKTQSSVEGEIKRVSYSSMVREKYTPAKEEVIYEDTTGGEELHPEDDEKGEPYTISPERFVNECPHYDKIDLTFYREGGILVEDGEEVSDPDAMVGLESLKKFGEYEDGVVYVRNDKVGTDYSIILEEGQFYNEESDEPF